MPLPFPTDLAPLPMNSPLRPASRASHLSGYASGDTTPRTRGAKIVNYFSSKLDRVAKLMSGEGGPGRRGEGALHGRVLAVPVAAGGQYCGWDGLWALSCQVRGGHASLLHTP